MYFARSTDALRVASNKRAAYFLGTTVESPGRTA